MPYISTKISLPLARETRERLSAAYGELISIFPGKTERWLMLSMEGNAAMYFDGTPDPCAIVTISLFGKGSADAYDKMTAAVCALIAKECAIPKDRIYVKYEEVEHWGWNGINF